MAYNEHTILSALARLEEKVTNQGEQINLFLKGRAEQDREIAIQMNKLRDRHESNREETRKELKAYGDIVNAVKVRIATISAVLLTIQAVGGFLYNGFVNDKVATQTAPLVDKVQRTEVNLAKVLSSLGSVNGRLGAINTNIQLLDDRHKGMSGDIKSIEENLDQMEERRTPSPED